MNSNEFEGAARNIGGRVQDAAGALAGDAGLQLKGKAQQVAGSLQEKGGEALNSAREIAAQRPVGSMIAAAAIGFALGALWARRD
jgi:uncharacterized protein YjbJ (UPF0337 family)